MTKRYLGEDHLPVQAVFKNEYTREALEALDVYLEIFQPAGSADDGLAVPTLVVSKDDLTFTGNGRWEYAGWPDPFEPTSVRFRWHFTEVDQDTFTGDEVIEWGFPEVIGTWLQPQDFAAEGFTATSAELLTAQRQLDRLSPFTYGDKPDLLLTKVGRSMVRQLEEAMIGYVLYRQGKGKSKTAERIAALQEQGVDEISQGGRRLAWEVPGASNDLRGYSALGPRAAAALRALDGLFEVTSGLQPGSHFVSGHLPGLNYGNDSVMARRLERGYVHD